MDFFSPQFQEVCLCTNVCFNYSVTVRGAIYISVALSSPSEDLSSIVWSVRQECRRLSVLLMNLGARLSCHQFHLVQKGEGNEHNSLLLM